MGQDAIGTAGGLAIMWNPEELIFENWTSLPRILIGSCRVIGCAEKFLITGVYGPHIAGERERFLKNVQEARGLYPEMPWIIGGDFNLIRIVDEKKGGMRRPDQYMDMFNEMISEQRLVDMQTINGIFTWNNRRGGKNRIASRLDRFLVSESIMNRDVFLEAKIMPSIGSDHWPVRLEIDINKNSGKNHFIFESFWLRNPQFLEKAEEWWTQSTLQRKGKMHTFQLKLKELRGNIKKWNKEEFGNIMEEKQRLEQEMEEIQQTIIIEGRLEESCKTEGILISKLEERRKQEEILWRQKSRINWLREGERNTKFFHHARVQHRQRNRILSIKNEAGERVIEQEGIEKVLVDYHKDILTEPENDRGAAIENICKEIPKMVREEKNKALMRVVTIEELEEIVMNMKKGKAPGPDRFTTEFFQAGWRFLGKEILELVEESSTLIAKRIKPLLANLISPEQTGFVEGRQILDGLVVTQEVIHTIREKKQKGMMIKLDLSKAYDRLNWKYLKRVMESFGFNNRWMEWVFSMISTANFSILINGIPSTSFNDSRGIRQGDPLSPFLFILVAEGLGRFFKKEQRERKIRGLKLWGSNLPITHQQFVDDIMLFCEATIKEVKGIKRIMDIFMEALGMKVNKEKSCTFVFNTLESIKSHLTRTLGFRQGELPTKYLGNQIDFHPTRMVNWLQVIEKLKSKLAGWAFRTLNIAGRVVLVKSVLQAIPIYPLSIIAAPKGACSKIKELYGKFIWGGPN
eukprot:PITA_35368